MLDGQLNVQFHGLLFGQLYNCICSYMINCRIIIDQLNGQMQGLLNGQLNGQLNGHLQGQL